MVNGRILMFLACVVVGIFIRPGQPDPAELVSITSPKLPADIMSVRLEDETWKYRLYANGEVRKIVDRN